MITSHNCLEHSAALFLQQELPEVREGVTAALIGPEGGTLRVTDPGSLLFGTTLRIPAGALETLTWIQIEQGEHPCSFGLGPSVKITPEGLAFKRPAEIDMRITCQSAMAEEALPSFYVFDEGRAKWVAKDGRAMEPENGVFRCSIWRL